MKSTSSGEDTIRKRGRLKAVLRMLVILAILPCPGSLKRAIGNKFLNWNIHKTAYIGYSVLGVKRLVMDENARIGHFTVIRDIEDLRLGHSARIGQWSWISAAPSLVGLRQGNGQLLVSDHAAITSRHYIDCSGGVHVGAFTTIAGGKTTILTHQIDLVSARQTTHPVVIGAYCFVGSDVKITPGAYVPDRCVIGMGAVVAGKLEEEGMLYVGVPARPIKRIDSGKYFTRTRGYVEA